MAIGKLQTIIESEDLTARVNRQILKQIMRVLGSRHKQQRVADHFRRNAKTNPVSGEYRYARRTSEWKERKRRIMAKIGGDPERPLFFRGDLEESVRTTSRLTVTSTRWTWKASAHRPLPHQQRRELEAVANSERDQDADTAEEMYVRLAAQPWARRRRRRKSN